MLTPNKGFWAGSAGGSADENTIFLMNFNSTPFVDESSNAYDLTAYDDADTSQDTTNTMFSSAGSYQGPASSSDDQSLQNFGNGDYIGYFSPNSESFTVEFFFRVRNTNAGYALAVGGFSSASRVWLIRFSTKPYFYWYNTSASAYNTYGHTWNSGGTGTENIAVDTWYYYCLRHDGTNHQLFCDKASYSTARLVAERTVSSMTGNMPQKDRFCLGARPYSDSSGNESVVGAPFLGQIDSVRISDIARYTVDTSGSIDSIPMPQAELS
jgi:hypothetical protein